jgi:hypothetical protein
MKPNTAKAWGYLCRDKHGKYTLLAGFASQHKCWCANPPVRVRVIREGDYRELVGANARLDRQEEAR